MTRALQVTALTFLLLAAFALVGCGERQEYLGDGAPLAPGTFVKAITVNDRTECVVVHGYRGNAITCDWESGQ